MKLLQLNMWMARLTPQILKLVEEQNPDIITAQEIFDCDGKAFMPTRTFDLFEQITRTGKYQHSSFAPAYQYAVGDATVSYGNATFSRYPIISQQTVYTDKQMIRNMTSQNYVDNIRNALITTLDIDGTAAHVINHHAFWVPTPVGNEESVRHMQVVADAIAKLNGPIILAGDLNVDPGTPPMQVFPAWLRDLTADYGLPTTLSTLGKVKNVACDHILVNDRVLVHGFRSLDDLVSDHLALILEFEL